MNSSTDESKGFVAELREQRWDDHRYYHQSRVNQALHLLSACCFLVTYAWLFVQPSIAAIFGWIVPMWVRQIGHFFFEPKGFDEVNQATHEHKEAIKVGFNLQRKVILLGLWLTVPVLVWVVPAAFQWLPNYSVMARYAERLGTVWLYLAGAGLLGRTLFLMVTRSAQTGIVWFTKIMTDPFHDIKMYHRAPLHLLRGERLDPMHHVEGQR